MFKKGQEIIIIEEGIYNNMKGTVIEPGRYYPNIEVRTYNPNSGKVVDRLFSSNKLDRQLKGE